MCAPRTDICTRACVTEHLPRLVHLDMSHNGLVRMPYLCFAMSVICRDARPCHVCDVLPSIAMMSCHAMPHHLIITSPPRVTMISPHSSASCMHTHNIHSHTSICVRIGSGCRLVTTTCTCIMHHKGCQVCDHRIRIAWTVCSSPW